MVCVCHGWGKYFRTELGGRLSRELLYVWYLNNVHIIN